MIKATYNTSTMSYSSKPLVDIGQISKSDQTFSRIGATIQSDFLRSALSFPQSGIAKDGDQESTLDELSESSKNWKRKRESRSLNQEQKSKLPRLNTKPSNASNIIKNGVNELLKKIEKVKEILRQPGSRTEWIDTVTMIIHPSPPGNPMHLDHKCEDDARYVDHATNIQPLKNGKFQATLPQRYNPVLDSRFPIRSPSNPSWVHEAYADSIDPTHCKPDIVLKSIQLDNVQDIWNKFYNKKLYDRKGKFERDLKKALEEEFNALLKNEQPPSGKHLKVVELQEEHCEDSNEFAILGGQYGVILSDYQKQPLLNDKLLVCFFSGALLESKSDYDVYTEKYSEVMLEKYAVNIDTPGNTKAFTTSAPYGGGNVTQYINTASKWTDDNQLELDQDKCHCDFLPVTLTLEVQCNEKPIKQKVRLIAVIQSRPVEPTKQLRLFYGEDYPLSDLTTSSQIVQQENHVVTQPHHLTSKKAAVTPQSGNKLFVEAQKAVNEGNIEALRKLIKNNPGLVNHFGSKRSTLLMNAAFKVYPKIVQLLIKHGANVNVRDAVNMTAFMYLLDRNCEAFKKSPKKASMKSECIDIAQQLLKAGVDLTAQDKQNDMTALMYAAQNGHDEIVEMMIKANVALEVKENKTGMTALMHAACYGHKGIVKLLINANADQGVQNEKTGMTALAYAEYYGYGDIVSLMAAGVDLSIQVADGETDNTITGNANLSRQPEKPDQTPKSLNRLVASIPEQDPKKMNPITMEQCSKSLSIEGCSSLPVPQENQSSSGSGFPVVGEFFEHQSGKISNAEQPSEQLHPASISLPARFENPLSTAEQLDVLIQNLPPESLNNLIDKLPPEEWNILIKLQWVSLDILIQNLSPALLSKVIPKQLKLSMLDVLIRHLHPVSLDALIQKVPKFVNRYLFRKKISQARSQVFL